ncbi:MAG: polyprenyl synthetase family protein [Planctomycetes bacterium]|nr:polyprenyl synthetase family protein [Planctomycetota bacterium]
MPILDQYKTVSADLEVVRQIFDQELTCDNAAISEMIEQTGRFQGKMLRPLLVLLSGQACGPTGQSHQVVAAVTEMVHLATLIHDDVLDEAQQRRGNHTINHLHGNEKAVLLGDMLISHAYHLCSSLEDQTIARRIAAATNTVCEGELIQLKHRGRCDLTEEQYFDIITRKTASLLETCCYLGVKLTRADESTCQIFAQYGRNVGIAFQIRDDILDLIGDAHTLGKTLGSDLQKEKLTLPGIHYISQSAPQEIEWVRQIFSSPTPQNLNQYKERLVQTGSIDYAWRQAKKFIENAKNNLPQARQNQSRQDLIKLADSIMDH